MGYTEDQVRAAAGKLPNERTWDDNQALAGNKSQSARNIQFGTDEEVRVFGPNGDPAKRKK